MTWLVTGAGGMLAHDVLEALAAEDERAVGLTRADLDICDQDATRRAIEEHRPDVVVNCAAWAAVDAAEEHEAEALRVNGDGPRNLAESCAATGARLLHVSTDYVFGGDGDRPYDEDAEPAPRTAYGRTKLAGERAVLETLPDNSAVARIAWLYGGHGRNFVATMIRLQRERDTVDVVTDQRGQPTWTRDVADRLVTLGRRTDATGIFHATNAGEASWFDLAREVFRHSGADPERVRPTTSDAFVLPAPRPAYSVLGHRRWDELGAKPARDWREALGEAFSEVVDFVG